jgi:hypothetical protein
MPFVRRIVAVLCVALGAAFWPAANASASILDIQIVGLSFNYDHAQNGSLFDAASITKGEATRVLGALFSVDGTPPGLLPPNELLYVDFKIDGIYNIPSTGGSVIAASADSNFFFNLLNANGRLLALDFEEATITYARNQYGSGIQLSFVAYAPSAGVVFQDLPFGLEISPFEEITINISTLDIINPVEQNNHLTSFSSLNGTAEVIGLAVPEPATVVVWSLLGAVGWLGIRVWRRGKHVGQSGWTEENRAAIFEIIDRGQVRQGPGNE